MRLLSWRLAFTLYVILSALCFVGEAAKQSNKEAYVTLLYGDEFLLGVRVLGKSIRQSGSTKDMVVLVSDGVSQFATNLIQADGWIVEKISLLANPNSIRPKRFWGVYTKLKIFNMTTYKKVVYLDADTIVVKNIDDLFKCSKFCANLKHSERLNSGVLVVEPSKDLFKDMMSKVSTLPSYTGGDQGFLNSYYASFPNAHVFEPDLASDILKSRAVPEMERLSTIYNADVGLYMLANKWMVDESELKVIHYTLGPLKPWDWWTSWLLKPVDVWQKVRVQLNESLPGTDGGKNPNDALLVKFLFLIPLVLILFCYYRSFLKTRSVGDHMRHLFYICRTGGVFGYSSISSIISSNQQLPNGVQIPAFLGGISVLVCFIVAVVSLGISLSIIPRQIMPWTGLLLMYEWTYTLFFLLFGSYLHLIYQWGRHVGHSVGSLSSSAEPVDPDLGKGHIHELSSCDVAMWHYGLGMATLSVAAPALPCIFGVTALFLRLALMIVGSLVLASFMTYASEHLAIRSFNRGLEDRDSQKSRSIFLFC